MNKKTDFWQKLKKPFTVLAPMDDVTDYVFRELISEIGKPDVFFTEFTSIDGMLSKGSKKVMTKLTFSENQRPIVAQIWGTEPSKFYEAAKIIEYLKFDGIDINMGCPDKSVMKKGAGAGSIGNYKLVTEIISAVKNGAPTTPISLKTRLAPTPETTEAWLTTLLKSEINALILHARTAEDLSKVPAKWDEIKKLVKLKNKISPDTIIIGNGDINSLTEAKEKHKKYGPDGIMIGRGVFHNPWIFLDNTEVQHSTSEYISLLKRHISLFENHWGSSKNFETLKKFVKMYIKNFKGADYLRQQLMDCKKSHQMITIIEEFFKSYPNVNA